MTSCCWYYPPAFSSIFLTSPCSGCLLFWTLTCLGRCQVGKSVVGLGGFSGCLTLLSHKWALQELCKHLRTGTLAPPEGFSCSPGKIKALPCSLSLQDSYLLGSELRPWLLLGRFPKQLPDGNRIQFLQSGWFWTTDNRVITAYSYSLNQPNPELSFLPSLSKCLNKWSQVFSFLWNNIALIHVDVK